MYIEHGPIESKWPTPAKKKALPCLKCSRVVGDEATDYLGQRPWGRAGVVRDGGSPCGGLGAARRP